MNLVRIAVIYVFAIALVAIALDQGSLPEAFDMGYFELFSYFFVLITGAIGMSVYSLVVYRRVSERTRRSD